jgi:hypothetical protein
VYFSAQVENKSTMDLLGGLAPVHSAARVNRGVVLMLIKGDLLRDVVLSKAIDFACSKALRR